MNSSLSILAFLGVFCILSAQAQQKKVIIQSENKVETDQFGRIIQNSNGEKINYSKKESELISSNARKKATTSFTGKQSQPVSSNRTSTLINCGVEWKYSIMGDYIGDGSMNSLDINNDGKIEILCSARIDYNKSIWYILQYNENTNEYKQLWVSDSYDLLITGIKVFDIDSDGVYEIIIGFENGEIQIVKENSKSVIAEYTVPNGQSINDIEFNDINNDGLNDLAFGTDNAIYYYNTSTFLLAGQIAYGVNDFSIGNVDMDSANEIITSTGSVLCCIGSTTSLEWVFDNTISSDNGIMTALSDVDNDGMKEGILAKAWETIDVYDINTQTLKCQITANLDIAALLMADVNNDGTDELIFGNGQWGEIHCYNASANTQMWQIDNPNHGVTEINIADVNNDGSLEVLWGAGATSSGADNLYIADIATETIEWTSIAIDGPFYATAIDDIDNDGVKEIVSISYKSESGYGSGIISVFDAETKELEWQSNSDYLYLVWTGVFDVKINDIDNDGTKEIIVAAGQTYTGKIWIIDGISKNIESSHLFNSQSITEFRALDIDDVDSDGDKEIVTGTSTNYYIINPQNFNIDYTSTTPIGGNPIKIKIENIDTDSEKEIIICAGNLSIHGGISHQQWISTGTNYTNFVLYDMNADGIKEIIASKNNGYIDIYDGNTMQIVTTTQLSNYSIDGITVTTLDCDTIPEIIVASNGYIFISSQTMSFTTNYFGQYSGSCNSLVVSDINNDGGKDIVFGANSHIMQMSSECIEDLWLTIDKSIEKKSCNASNDGSVAVIPFGVPPYSYSWNTGTTDSLLTNLAAGTYTVTVADSRNCEVISSFIVPQAQLIANYTSTQEYCYPSSNATATVHVVEGTPPYSFNWSNGATSSIVNNLSHGNYSVSVTDSLNCAINHAFQIVQDTITMSNTIINASCFGSSNGKITLVPQGTPPYSYVWSTGQTSAVLQNILAGNYDVTLTDSHGCIITDSFTVTEPTEILLQTTTTPDNSNTSFGEGTATVNAIGGVTPYSILWNDPFGQTTITAINLLAGNYSVKITDQKGCVKTSPATVSSFLGMDEEILDFRVYPNPASDLLYLDIILNTNQNVTVQIFNSIGELIHKEIHDNINNKTLMIDGTNYESGFYTIEISIENSKTVKVVEIVH